MVSSSAAATCGMRAARSRMNWLSRTRLAGPLQPLRHVGIQAFQVLARAGRIGLDDQQDQRQFLEVDFLHQAQHLLGVGVGPGRQQEQAIGVGRRVAADALEGALPKDQAEGLLQVGEDGTGEALVVGDQGEAGAGHGWDGPPRGPRPGRRVVPEMAAERIKVVQRVGVRCFLLETWVGLRWLSNGTGRRRHRVMCEWASGGCQPPDSSSGQR